MAVRTCKVCGERGTEDRPLSRRGNHLDCGAQRLVEQNIQLAAKEGPYYDAWREAMRRVADAV